MFLRIPLNQIQQRFWLDDLLKYPTAEYNDTNYTFIIEGNISISLLMAAFRTIMDEYAPLHSTIEVDNGVPYFNIDNEFKLFFFKEIDSNGISSSDEINKLLEDLVNEPFDLQREYPCKFYIVHNGEKHFLLTVFHHVVMDGFTIKYFFQRLSSIYNQLLKEEYVFVDQTKKLIDFNVSFESMCVEHGSEDVAYWRTYLQNVPLRLSLAKSYLDKENSGEKKCFFSFTLDVAGLAEKVDKFCVEQETTHFRVYSAVWALTLAKIFSTEEIVLDHTLNMCPKEDPFLGVFVNNLPLVYHFHDIEMNKSFEQLIRYSNINRCDEQKHLYAFYRDILPSNNSKKETINIGINYPTEYDSLSLSLDGCNICSWGHINVEVSTDLLLAIESNNTNCVLRYNSNISLEVIHSLSTVFVEVLRQSISNPLISLKEIKMLPDLQQQILVEKENSALHMLAPRNTFLSQFSQAVSEHPTQIAIVYEDISLTYADLDKLSDKVASALLKRNITHQRVGLSTPKNIEMVIGILGILKSANIYVPIDYEYPIERINFIVRDSQIAVLLFTADTFIPSSAFPFLVIDDLLFEEIAPASLLPDVYSEDDAYIIYTSGTTGTPKGIPIKHYMLNQTIINNVWIQQLNSSSRVIQFANIVFDASIVEIFPALTVGATLYLPTEEVRKDVNLLLSFLEKYKISSFNVPPALLSTFPHKDCPFLKTIVIGGDTSTLDTIRFWCKNRLLINAYGPTENCVDATCNIVKTDSLVNDIGISMPGVTCYVLDKYMNLMPDYAIGELYIGGIKLTEGYLNRPELNKEKFVQNPYATPEDQAQGINLRLYKSGDLVMHHKNGHLEFIGRSDFQIKLNGYRIELGDIESKILDFGSVVKNAVVIVHEHGSRKLLVAYVQTSDIQTFPLAALKEFLHSCLPLYMIPSEFILLTDFPYNTSGKVDRKRLPVPVPQYDENHIIVPLVTDTERRLAALWAGLLPEQSIGRDDSFISMGGDSMAVIQLSFRIQDTFGIQIHVPELYQHINLKDQAAYIDNCLNSFVEDAKNKAVVDDIKESLSLTPAQMALWLACVKSDAIKNAYNLPCMFELPGSISTLAFQDALNQLVKVQDGFRTYFPLDKEGKPYLQVAEFIPSQIDICEIAEDELIECLNQDMEVSFDLSHPYLFHCKLYRVDSQKYVCSLVMHHLISDGWSAKFIQLALEKAVSGMSMDWSKYSGSFMAYAKEINDFCQTDAYVRRIQYWKNSLQNVSDLRWMHSNPSSADDVAGGKYTYMLPEELTETIDTFCRKQSCTHFVFYASVYLYVLSRMFHQTDFVVGFPFLGREHSRYSRVVGYFVQTLPLLFRREYLDMPFEQYLNSVYHNLTEAEAHSVSLDRIVEAVRKQTGNKSLQLVQSMFAYEKKASFYDWLRFEKATFDLSFTVLSDKNNQATLQIEYKQSCLLRADIEKLVSAYMAILSRVVGYPNDVLNKFSLAGESYCQSIIMNNTLSVAYREVCPSFLESFASIVHMQPAHPAIVYEGNDISYQELNRLSDKVASAIRSMNIPGSSAIAVCMPSSIDTIATIVGILKAGCCYVPLDVNLPNERRDYQMKNAGCRMLFSPENFPQGVVINHSGQLLEELQSCAYIIYTSGTTGQPKGVPVTHNALSRLISTERRRFNLTPDSRVLLFSSISFDASVTEIFTTLSAGSTLVIASPQQRQDPELLADLLESQAVTCATIPPVLLPLLPHRRFPLLSTLIVGGETTAFSALEYWCQNRTLINAYGPTENTVDTTLCLVDKNFEPNDIGMPLPGVSCYVLDEYLNIVPDDMVGELYIGGLQLTNGYLNNSALNAQKFISNPYVTDEDKRNTINTKLYKSGDLVKRRSDGHFIFIGRADNQVKLNGYRIELSEIETLIQQFPSVQHALVELQKRGEREELVAYVQPRSDASVDVARLQEFLHSHLPVYMIPSKWAVVTEFPLTINGKIDKKKLPVPEIVSDIEIVPAATSSEQQMLSIACNIMGTDAIGVETDLLDAGMTSMQVIEFVGRVMTNMDLHITASSVYKNRTVRNLLNNGNSKLYFWVNEADKDKPLLVLICGYPYYHPFYDDFIAFFKDYYSIFVFESYHEYFLWKSEVSVDILIDFYLQITKLLLVDRPIYAVTGYCMGAELAMHYASRLKKEQIASPKVIMMEGFYKRTEDNFYPDIKNNPVVQEHYRITYLLSRSLPVIDYQGEIIIFLAKKLSNRLYLEFGEETNEVVLKEAAKEFMNNRINWKKAYPHAPYYELDCDHWTFFEEKNLEELREIIRKHWNI